MSTISRRRCQCKFLLSIFVSVYRVRPARETETETDRETETERQTERDRERAISNAF